MGCGCKDGMLSSRAMNRLLAHLNHLLVKEAL